MTEPVVSERGLFGRLYHGETKFQFIGNWKRWFLISGVVLIVGLASLATQGLNLGLDFEGGTSWDVPANGISVSRAQEEVRKLGVTGAQVQILRSSSESTLRVQAAPQARAKTNQVAAALARLTKNSVDEVSVSQVGPTWGEEVTRKAVRALIVFLVLITIYITIRFESRMALATLAALFHDVIVTTGVYSLFQFEVTPATVVAVLTILGYSIYDGIVVFDKVEENATSLAASGRMTYSDMCNLSLNQVLMRTLNTSLTALLPIISLLVIGSFMLGATTLEEFALALLVGLGSSAYSSIFIATPLLALLKEREPRYAAIRRRLAGREPSLLTPAMAATGGPGAGDERVPKSATKVSSATKPGQVKARQRKKGKRR